MGQHWSGGPLPCSEQPASQASPPKPEPCVHPAAPPSPPLLPPSPGTQGVIVHTDKFTLTSLSVQIIAMDATNRPAQWGNVDAGVTCLDAACQGTAGVTCDATVIKDAALKAHPFLPDGIPYWTSPTTVGAPPHPHPTPKGGPHAGAPGSALALAGRQHAGCTQYPLPPLHSDIVRPSPLCCAQQATTRRHQGPAPNTFTHRALPISFTWPCCGHRRLPTVQGWTSPGRPAPRCERCCRCGPAPHVPATSAALAAAAAPAAPPGA